MASVVASILSFLLILSPIMAARPSYMPKTRVEGPVPVAPGLSYTYYQNTCPFVEYIVIDYLVGVFQRNITEVAGLLRLHFHDCFVQGCDGSVLLDGSASGPSEQDAPPNLTLRASAFQIINDLHARIRSYCYDRFNYPVVSCSDIVALAARDSVFLAGGPYYSIPLGRKDSRNFATINESLANLPAPSSNTTTLLNALAKKNFTATDVVALSGGHTIGISHCTSFTSRLYPTQDPTMNQTLADSLKQTCPAPTSNNTTVLDVLTPNIFDNKYYVDLVNHKGLFTSDQDLYTDSRTRGIVTSFANNQTFFFEKFVEAILKMGQLSVLTGDQGEIRLNCSAMNPTTIQQWSVVDAAKPAEQTLSQYS